MAHIAIVSGSPSATSRLDGILNFVSQAILDKGLEVKWIHVRNLPPEDLFYTRFDSPSITEANRIIAEADGVVVASPIYKASYTGVFKSFLDLVPQKGLDGKVVLPLAIGGTIAHLLAIDHAFKPVLSALGAHHILSGAFILDSQVLKGEGGSFSLAPEIEERLGGVVQSFISETIWRKQRADTVTTVNELPVS
ncbi:NADPH-dependent FMN reductase [Paenibacillus agricola]|uniref:NADPH-dependent FMN reductase n=1 Tax=Paenibacillus agricola TaxID=2716264 RepID=A0ABX0J2P3_9BACL|nr:NADPH-dependent FMN reductase [Paenibacillus agricola]NHN30622.1 NADPH-dependent FMN reductase [Paenibacillus agricola]